MVDIRTILEEQGWKIERESGTAFFYNFAPWIAPKAYLHIVFRGANASDLAEVGKYISLPKTWMDVLSQQNGAILFSGAMSIYGVHVPGTLLDRSNFFEQLPFSIVSENRSWPPVERERYVCIGGYRYDGTRAIMDREDGTIRAMPRNNQSVLKEWSDASAWLAGELGRLAGLFDEVGRIRVSEEHTLPRRLQ